MTATNTPDLDEHVSSHAFDATIERLVRAIRAHGMTVFATIDHAANARDVGMTMPASTVLVYGNPKGGTPVMLATPSAALDLPLRVLVREAEDGKTIIAFHPVAGMLGKLGVSAEVSARLEPAQQLLLLAVGS